MPDFVWKQGDTGDVLTDVLTSDPTLNTPINSDGASVTARLRSLANAAITPLTGAAVFTDAAGSVQFSPSQQDTTNAVGNYLFEWVVTFPSGAVRSFPVDGYLWGRIEPSAATAPSLIVGLDDVKDHIGNFGPGDRSRDFRLMNLIQQITPLIEAQAGPIVPKVYDEWWDGGGNILSVLRQPSSGYGTSPVFRVLAASEYRGPIEYPLALVPSPAFGSIYSIFVNQDMGTITRRSAGGAVISFFPGREQVHIIYQAGQDRTPDNVYFAALEAVRMAYQWTRQVGRGSAAPADAMELGPSLTAELSRMIRTMLAPTRVFPSIA